MEKENMYVILNLGKAKFILVIGKMEKNKG